MKIYCDPLRDFVNIPEAPHRIVSLSTGLTETLVHMGYSDSIVGISEFCPRFVPHLQVPIAGDYLKINEDVLRVVRPDLIIASTGIQRHLAYQLHSQGLPVYLLPLPNSIFGIFENVMTLGALVNDLSAAHSLVNNWQQLFLKVDSKQTMPKPRVYAELWLGKYARMVGGLTYINNIIEAAGGENIFRNKNSGYLELDLKEVENLRPDIFLCYSEPEHLIQAVDLQQERGWDFLHIQADISPAHNIIHDGPSMIEALKWLRKSISELWQIT